MLAQSAQTVMAMLAQVVHAMHARRMIAVAANRIRSVTYPDLDPAAWTVRSRAARDLLADVTDARALDAPTVP